jgi:hypothetical protein
MSMTETGLHAKTAGPPPIPRCLGCRDRIGWPSFLEDGIWTLIPSPERYFGDEVTFNDVTCPDCMAAKGKS